MLNLANVSVGDKVAYVQYVGMTDYPPRFSSVEKVLKSRIKLADGLWFSRKTGQLILRDNFMVKKGYLVGIEEAEKSIELSNKAQQAREIQRDKKSAARELVAMLEKRYAPAGNIHLTTVETEAIKALTLLLKANREEI